MNLLTQSQQPGQGQGWDQGQGQSLCSSEERELSAASAQAATPLSLLEGQESLILAARGCTETTDQNMPEVSQMAKCKVCDTPR